MHRIAISVSQTVHGHTQKKENRRKKYAIENISVSKQMGSVAGLSHKLVPVILLVF